MMSLARFAQSVTPLGYGHELWQTVVRLSGQRRRGIRSRVVIEYLPVASIVMP